MWDFGKVAICFPTISCSHKCEKFLPMLDKTKFLVLHELTMTMTIIKNRMVVLASRSPPGAQVHRDQQDHDGFLYMSLASQQVLGH